MCGEYCSADSITVDFLILQNCVAEVDWEPNRVDKQYKLEYWHVGRAGKVRIATSVSDSPSPVLSYCQKLRRWRQE